jgi:hypothetical protein
MNSHKNAPLTPKGREAMVRSVIDGGLSKAAAARDRGQMGRTVPHRRCRWFARPLLKTSFIAKPNSASHVRSHRGFAPAALYTGKQIAVEVGVSPATVSRILQRRGLNRLSALEPAEPVREHPGEIRPPHHPGAVGSLAPAPPLPRALPECRTAN